MGDVILNQAEADRLKLALANLYYARNIRPILTVARLEAPILTGRLRRSHDSDLPRKDGRGLFIRLHAVTPYAQIVFRGASGGTRAVTVRPGRLVTIRHSRGRRPNPWFVRGFQRMGLRDVRNFG